MKVLGVAVSVWGSQGGPLHYYFAKLKKKMFLLTLGFQIDMETVEVEFRKFGSSELNFILKAFH